MGKEVVHITIKLYREIMMIDSECPGIIYDILNYLKYDVHYTQDGIVEVTLTQTNPHQLALIKSNIEELEASIMSLRK